MMMFKKLAVAAVAMGSLGASVPANAVVTTFAQFVAVSPAQNLRWVRGTTTATKANGSVYTLGTSSTTAAGTSLVDFTLGLGGTTVRSNFTLNGSTVGDAATTEVSGGNTTYYQNLDTGSFSFTAANAFTYNSVNYAAGTNLLTGTFTNGTLTGRLNSGGFFDSSNLVGSTVTFNSAVFAFGPNVTERSFALNLNSVSPTFGAASGAALNNFRATAGGSFAVTTVPEPAVWGLMIVGFGAVGFQSRRRRAIKTVTA